MNKTDIKSLIVSIVAGLAVNVLWALSTEPAATPIGSPPAATQWVLQARHATHLPFPDQPSIDSPFWASRWPG